MTRNRADVQQGEKNLNIYTGSAWGWLISLSNLCAGRVAFQTNNGVHQVMVRIRIPVSKFPFRKTGFVGCVLEPVVRKGPPLRKHLFPRPPGYSSGVLPVFGIDIHFTWGHILEQGSGFSRNDSMQVGGTCGQKAQNIALFENDEFTRSLHGADTWWFRSLYLQNQIRKSLTFIEPKIHNSLSFHRSLLFIPSVYQKFIFYNLTSYSFKMPFNIILSSMLFAGRDSIVGIATR